MVKTGLEIIRNKLPRQLKGKKTGVLCHAPSVASNFCHITDILSEMKDIHLSAIFGPQHGMFGQTQDNMIEWEGHKDDRLHVPVFSLYGKNRKPDRDMLKNIEAFVIDLQDVGARLYTYVWTTKLCIEACSEMGIPIWILDRPNPIGRLPYDGPVLKKEYFTFVGGASIPMCHRMTIGEMALWIKERYYNNADLNIVWMKDWHRDSLFTETGLPWVLPSPNMPSIDTSMVYPGTVLAEALNISEGRGTTIPFELTGAPFINAYRLKDFLDKRKISGCVFRVHGFIPTFNKYNGEYCNGIQIHVTDPGNYYPVATALEIFNAVIKTTPEGTLKFRLPPYEYETRLMPFDILSGDDGMRKILESGNSLSSEKERWKYEIEDFIKDFREISAYSE